jgi:hypothetical protein
MAAIEVKTKGFDRAIADQDKLNKTAEKQQRIVRATTDEVKRSASVQQRILRDTETQQERYNRKMREARVALAGHAREVELLARYENKLQTELRETTREYRIQGQVQSEAADRGFDAFKVAKWTAALAGAATAGRRVYSVLQDIKKETDALGDKAATESYDAGALMQLAGDDPAKAKQLLGMADQIYSEGYVADRSSAYRLAYQIGSAGLDTDRRFLSRLSVVDDSAGVAERYGQLRAAFSGGDNIGSVEQVVSKGIAASAPATGVSPSQIIEAAVTASVPAQEFGLTDEEVFSAVSMVAQKMSASEAGTAVGEMLSQLVRGGYAERLRGKGLPAIINEISSMGLDSTSLQSELGSKSAATAYQTLRNQSAYAQRLQTIAGSQNTGLASDSVENALNQERIAAAVAKRVGDAADTMTQDQRAYDSLRARGRMGRASSETREGGSSELNIRLNQWSEEVWRTMFGDSGSAEASRQRDRFAEVVGPGAERMTDLEVVAEALNRMAGATEKTAENTGKLVDKKEEPASIPVR